MGNKKKKSNQLTDAARNKIKSLLTKQGIPKPKIAPTTNVTNSLTLEENNFKIPNVQNTDICDNNIKIQVKKSFVKDSNSFLPSLNNEPAKIVNKKKLKKQSKIVSSIELKNEPSKIINKKKLKKPFKIVSSIQTDYNLLPATNNNCHKLKNNAPSQGKAPLNNKPPKIKKNKIKQNQQNIKLKYGTSSQEKLAEKRKLTSKLKKPFKLKKLNEFTITDIVSDNNLYNSDSDSDADDYIDTFFNDEADVDNSSNYTNGIQDSNGNEQLISKNQNIPNGIQNSDDDEQLISVNTSVSSDDYEMDGSELVHYTKCESISSDYDSADEDDTDVDITDSFSSSDDSDTDICKDYSFDSYSSSDDLDAHEDLCDLINGDYSEDSLDSDYESM